MSNYMMVVPVLGIATWTIVMLVVLVVLICCISSIEYLWQEASGTSGAVTAGT